MPAERVEALAQVWGGHRDRIVERVHEITRESGRVAWHINSREEAIGHMARMLAFLTDKIIEHRTSERSIDAIEPVEEQRVLQEQ